MFALSVASMGTNVAAVFAQTKTPLCPKVTTESDCVKFEQCKWPSQINKCVGKNWVPGKKSKKTKCKSIGIPDQCAVLNHCKWLPSKSKCKKK